MIYKYLYGGIAVLAVLVGLYLYGYNKGQDNVQAKFDAYKSVAQLAYDKQAAETARVQSEWDRSKEREGEINARLQVVTLESAGLSRGLRDYRTRLRALSDAALAAGDPDSTSGESGDLERLEAAHYAACSRDSERLTAWQAFYSSLLEAQ